MCINRDRKILDSLFDLAKFNDRIEKTPRYNYRLAAMLIIKGHSPFVGYNRKKSHPLQKKYSRHPESIYLHAEIDAIKNALRELDIRELQGSKLYIARAKKSISDRKLTQWGMCHPCEGCQQAIIAFGISKVIYTTDEHEVWGEWDL